MCSPYDIAKTVVDTIRTGIEIKKVVETKKEAKYQTELIKTQAKQSQQYAASERQEGIEEARRKKLQAILNMGDEKTAFASGNIALSSATALNVLDDEKQTGELDALLTLNSSEKSAEKYMRQSQRYYQNAALASFKAKNNYVNSLFGTTLKVAGKLNGYNKPAK